MRGMTAILRVLVRRWPMAGGAGTAYEVDVPLEDVPEPDKRRIITRYGWGENRGSYIDFEEAIQPDSLVNMPLGWDRLDAHNAHTKRARSIKLEVARSVFPELASVTDWPNLWIEGWTLPPAEVWTTYEFSYGPEAEDSLVETLGEL